MRLRIEHMKGTERPPRVFATIGPASSSRDGMDALIDAGLDVARLNCAHLELDELERMVLDLRARAQARGRDLPVLVDLAGPKIRLSGIAGGRVELKRDQTFRLVDPGGDSSGSSDAEVRGAALSQKLEPGHRLLLADGAVGMRVERVGEGEIVARLESDGVLTDGKGLAVPGVDLELTALTPADRESLGVALRLGVEFIGVSYVRSVQDVERAYELLPEADRPLLVAKIETPQAVADVERIARAADAVMVARGDLGIECPIEKVGVLQKRIVRRCRQLGTPSIVATQMLESMVRSPTPTRAEATDVTNAVLDGVAGILLSEETAVGRYPVDAVRMARKIIEAAREYQREAGPSASDA